MKKLLSTLILVLGLCPAAFSQTKGSTEFGVTLGYNGSTVTTTNTNADYRSGFNAGIGGEYYFSDSWGFKAKVLYDQKGWANGYIGSTITNFNLDYLTVPLLANWHFGHTKNWYLNFGPYVSFLTSAKTAVNSQDVKSIFNDNDAGLDLGIGVKFPVSGTAHFFIEVSGQGGVIDIAKSNSGSTISNSVSAINIGLNF
ncbi:outer membrane protein with beta-barrel domain [Mucilaginibacter gracilis]|uniref:Outer membrane protein with beta-barrel domain n=1 Tax=Mucilaginibacter gracilis TaxID=423350 RepID=A0A495J2E2_9SPHI|nr:porin family protein [Mucilaginibacter gracilis]RKR83130.1 outer membrane protein with beta-barrel domain [Mucilaginibacter gracilis]